MPKKINTEEKKTDIAREAMTLFITQGIINTGLGDIARECGMSRSNMYNYFANKEEIVQHIYLRFKVSFLDKARLLTENTKLTMTEKILHFFHMFITETEGYRSSLLVLIELWLLEQKDSQKKFVNDQERMGLNNAQELVRSFLEQGIENGEFKDHDTYNLSLAIISLIPSLVYGVVYLRYIKAEEAEACVETLLHPITCRTEQMPGDAEAWV